MNPTTEPFSKISFSLPSVLLAEIDARAKAERRSRSSWLVFHLEHHLADILPPKPLISLDPPADPAIEKQA